MVTRRVIRMDHRTISKGNDFCVQKKNLFLQNIGLIQEH